MTAPRAGGWLVGAVGLSVSLLTLAYEAGASQARRDCATSLALSVAELRGAVAEVRAELRGHDQHDTDALDALDGRVKNLEGRAR